VVNELTGTPLEETPEQKKAKNLSENSKFMGMSSVAEEVVVVVVVRNERRSSDYLLDRRRYSEVGG